MNSLKDSWRRLSSRGLVIALLDFLLLALAVYFGYALRLGIVIPQYVTDWLHVMCLLPLVCVIVFALFGQYNTICLHAGTEDYNKFLWLYIVSILAFLMINSVFKLAVFPRTSFAISFFAGLFLCGGLRFSWLMAKSIHTRPGSERQKTLIIGAGEAGAFLARDLMRNQSELYPTGFVDDDVSKIGRHVSGLRVLGSTAELRSIAERYGIQVVLIAIPSANGQKIRKIYDTLAPMNIQVRILPSLRELAGGTVSVSRLRKVRLEDLLGREPVRINLDASMNYIQGRRVLITGAGGSIGSEIVRQVIHNSPAEIFALGHGEQSIYLLLEGLAKFNTNIPVHPVIADVADQTAIRDVFEKFSPEVIFHAAAHKHVPLMETCPREAMRVNDLGTRTIARFAGMFHAQRMVMISTDKAVNPSSVMGATKRLAEKILENEQREFPETKFMAVRFGNVLGSRGSVIPKFEEQIASGGPVTVTHPGMKRYFMLIPEAVSLVVQAGALGHGGEIFVLNMGEPVVIKDMAELLIRLCGYEPYKDIDIVFSGIRPGEKLYEELFYDENAVHGTLHPKIYVSNIKSGQNEPLTPQDINPLLERALTNPDDALGILKQLVPEFRA
ncbi:MAG: polysaccharide biosynthesis protein [Synergistaceae bacterium]|nr:polysaccharide biosynthesis protein [Synergistaceae bacterium]